MSLAPTDEQLVAIEYPYNKAITARPGSGKTFTLAQMIVKDSKDLLSYQGIIAISIRNRSFYGTIDSFCINEIVAPFLSRFLKRSVDLKIIDSVNSNKFDERTKDEKVIEALKTGKLPINMLCSAAVLILDRVEAAKLYVKARYKSVYVDEYQDCGSSQHRLIMWLASMGLKTVVVGDLDQAIFGWANKSSEYLSNLISSTDFRHFALTRNHRCHPSIINYSLRLIGHTDNLLPTDELRVIRARIMPLNSPHSRNLVGTDESSIAQAIERFLPNIKNKYKVQKYSDFAILARSNATLVRFQEALTVPSKRHADSVLDRGISKWRRVFIMLLEMYFSPNRFVDSFLDDYSNLYSKPSTRAKTKLLVLKYLSLAPGKLCEETSLAVEIAKRCEPRGFNGEDIEAYQKVVSDSSVTAMYYGPPKDNEVNLLTYHKAKGLEFDVVFCLDTYEYVIPPPNCRKTDSAYKDALSLHYVGITRARKVCYIPIATRRHNSKGELRDASPSHFFKLNDINHLRREVEW